MTKLVELTENFTVSRPVFCLQLDTDRRYIIANTSHPKYIYRPIVTGVPLADLVCENYREHFDVTQKCFTIDKNEIANKAMQQIRSSIIKFIEKNLEMHNPRQSKLYRWAYHNMPYDSEINNVFVMVYKYLRSFSDSGMRSKDLNHINNGIAILKAIMEKHER